MSSTPGTEQVLLALLIAGHALGDFVFQTRLMMEGKGRPAVLLRHAAAVTAAHLLALLPFLSWNMVAAAAALGAAHGVVDGAKARWQRRNREAGRDARVDAALGDLPPTPLHLFLIDQAAHVATVVGAWLVLRGMDPDAWFILSDEGAPTLYAMGVLLTAFAFVGNGGSGLVRGVLAHLEVETDLEAEDSLLGNGHVIGILERWLALILVLLGEWTALALALAAKTITRDRPGAEYYLAGTLASLLVAVLTGLAVQLALP